MHFSDNKNEHYITVHLHLQFIDPSVCPMALSVKHVIYHNSQLTCSHFIVTYRTHPLNNKTQNNTFIKQSQTLHTA